MSSVSSFLKLSPRETLLDEWEILDDAGFPDLGDFFAALVGFAFCLVPGFIALWNMASRPRKIGYLCLTNRRCVYLERGEGVLKNTLRVAATNLDDVVAVHSVYEETLWGVQSLTLVIYTKFEDSIGIRIGETGSWVSKIPLVGPLFHRHSLGRDALRVPPVLFEHIEQRRREKAAGGSAF